MELVKITKLTSENLALIKIFSDESSLKIALSGAKRVEVGDQTNDVPKLYYKQDFNDNWSIYALDYEFIDWNSGRIVTQEPAPTPEPQVQANWNQNDENARDFIKGRICYATALTRGYTDADSDVEQVTFAGYMSDPAVYNCYKDANASIEVLRDRIFTSIRKDDSPSIKSDTYNLGNSNEAEFTEIVDGKLWGCITSVDLWYEIYICTEPCSVEISDTVAVFPYAGYYFVKSDSEGTYQYYIPSDITGKHIPDWFIPTSVVRTSDLGGVKFKVDDSILMVSIDGGENWLNVEVSN